MLGNRKVLGRELDAFLIFGIDLTVARSRGLSRHLYTNSVVLCIWRVYFNMQVDL